MSMSNIQHSASNFHYSFKHFSKLVHLSATLRQANIIKHHGVKVIVLFQWLLVTIFKRYSVFRALTPQDFSKKTVRNCLNNPHTNWQRLVVLIAMHLIQYVQHFTDSRRRQTLIIDDSLFKREFSRNTEMLGSVYDHNKDRHYNGFRGLSLGWSDGNTFLPVNFALMTSNKRRLQIGPMKIGDRRTLAGQRRAQALRPMNQVALELIDTALKAGSKAGYVLFDSWYTSPKVLWQLLKRGLYTVSMFKNTKKIYFRYRGRQMNVKTLFQRLTRDKRLVAKTYLYSPIVDFEIGSEVMPVKLVFVTNQAANSTKKFLVLGSTNLNLKPDQIIQLYARRWQIEGYFKVAKQYLQYDHVQTQSYDGLCGHMAMVLLAYDVLALAQREAEDDRTLGGIFFDYGRSLPDITVVKALSWLMNELIGIGVLDDDKADPVNHIFKKFMTTLPSSLGQLLGNVG